MVLSILIAVPAAESGWFVLAGPPLLALGVVSVDVLDPRPRGESPGPPWAALSLGARSCWPV